jgi:acetyltransferase-like isoleucine patch superfamily enzyme
MTLPPTTAAQALRDRVTEFTGTYRLGLALRGVRIAWGATVKSPSRLQAARGCFIQAGAIVHCGGRPWSHGLGHVVLGEGVVIGPRCIVYGAGGVVLDRYVHLGPGVMLMSQAGQHGPGRVSASPRYQFAPIQVGEGSWIGAGAVLLPGAVLGRCVSVAPNSVVSGTIPDYAVVAGNPCRLLMHQAPLQE